MTFLQQLHRYLQYRDFNTLIMSVSFHRQIISKIYKLFWTDVLIKNLNVIVFIL